MRIYLDACTLQRPVDEPIHRRIVIEAEAVRDIIAYFECGIIELIDSTMLRSEISGNPFPQRRTTMLNLLKRMTHHVEIDQSIVSQARQFVVSGVKPFDALHLASAIAAKADYFSTCDDTFLKRARTVAKMYAIRVGTPVELLGAIDQWLSKSNH